MGTAPFISIHSDNNEIYDPTNSGLSILANNSKQLTDSSVSNNKILSVVATVNSLLTVHGMVNAEISSNIVRSVNGNPYVMIDIQYIYDSLINDNKFWSENITGATLIADTIYEVVMKNNFLRGGYAITNITNSEISNNKWLSNGTVRGLNSGTRFEVHVASVVFYRSSTPTAEVFLAGDEIINSSPSAGGYRGWYCTASGTPGTWKGYGALEA